MPVAPREVGKVSTVGNLTSSGAIGTASIDTDVRAITMAQSTAGLTFTLPAPNDTSVVAGIDVINIGTASFAMYGEVVSPSSLIRLVWMGSAWVSELGAVGSAPSSTNANVSLPGGYLLKGGQATSTTAGVASVTFPVAFPTACISVTATVYAPSANALTVYSVATTSFSKTGCAFQVNALVTALLLISTIGGTAATIHWQAIGY